MMDHRWQRFLALLLCVTMVLGGMSLPALAESGSGEENPTALVSAAESSENGAGTGGASGIVVEYNYAQKTEPS